MKYAIFVNNDGEFISFLVMNIPEIVNLQGRFDDQCGTAKRGRITGYNGSGVACREYTWIKPKLSHLEGKKFEAFDTQIKSALVRKTRKG